MASNTGKLLKEILNEASTGTIIIGTIDGNSSWTFDVNFLLNYRNRLEENPESLPILNVQNMNLLVYKLDKYLEEATEFYQFEKEYWDLDDEQFKKKLIFDLFVSATPQDFENILPYIDHRTEMLLNNCEQNPFIVGQYNGLNVVAKVKKNSSNLEAPFKMKIAFTDDQNQFMLPQISFGIDDKDQVNIYSIQNKIQAEKNPLHKKLDRLFRSVNKNVSPEEDIANISPNALVAFTIFASCFEQQGYNNLVFHTNMPLRYQSRVAMTERKTGSAELAHQEADRIEYSATNRLLYTAERFAHHFPNSRVEFDDITNNLYLKTNTKMAESDFEKNPDLKGNIIYDINAIASSKNKTEEQQK